MLGVRARISANEVELGDGHIELGLARVVDPHEFGLALGGRDGLQSLIAADAVLDMNDGVSDLELADVSDHRLDAGGGFADSALSLGCVDGVKLVFREDGDSGFGELHALGEGADSQADRVLAGEEFRESIDILHADLIFPKEFPQAGGSALACGGDEHALFENGGLCKLDFELCGRVLRLSVDGKIKGGGRDLVRRNAAESSD